MRILIVDDDADAARGLADLLLFYGHQALVAHSATEGLRLGEVLRPEVVITDIGMPGVSGLEAARLFRQTGWGSHARLIALTGWPAARAHARILKAGFFAHLRKPVEIAELLLALPTQDTGWGVPAGQAAEAPNASCAGG
ncbi:response regulator [Aquabacterium sp. A7-Y]|uniref:response regulator n=1 Tax=Aquabacterium sp. A7-Y TaxID=1349605 RepID=UPI00223D96F7|nr:response regulator [Aquabacterium sp. A7-Y]MCW7537848.1 response regulator [Aquabacterium sp. A7-Y]